MENTQNDKIMSTDYMFVVDLQNTPKKVVFINFNVSAHTVRKERQQGARVCVTSQCVLKGSSYHQVIHLKTDIDVL